MKNFLFKTSFISLLTMFFTGCAAYTIQGNYSPEYLSYELKTKAEKVNSVNVLVKDSNQKGFHTGPDAIFIGKGYEIKIDKNFNKNVTKDFMSQYFKNVSLSDTKSDIVLDTSIIDFSYFMIHSVDIKTKIKVRLYFRDKLILNKLYTIEYESEKIYESLTMETHLDARREQLLKAYLDIYEKYIKEDLLKALEENI